LEAPLAGNNEWKLEPQELDAVLSGFGHTSLLRHRYHDHGPDWIELAMPWQDGFVGDDATGEIACGPVIALMDNAAGTSIWLKRGGYLPQVTIDLRIDYLRPIKPGATLIGRCECYSITPTVAFTRGVAYETSIDDPACHVAAAFMLLEGEGR
jgi:uncharacterized protein (TIGR00369 family)